METSNGMNGLKRDIGFFGLLAMSVGLNIGGSLFALTTLAAGMSGPSLPLAMLIAAIPCLLAVIPYGILTSALPTTAATYRYIQLLNPAVSLTAVLTLLVCILIGAQPLFALAFGKYLAGLVPVDPILSGVLVLTVFYLVNLMGIKFTVRLQILLLVLLLAALVLFIGSGLPLVHPERFATPFPYGTGGMMMAAGLLFTFSAGGFFVIDMGGEVIGAKRQYPRVLFLGILIVVVLNILIMVVVVGITDISEIQGKSLIHVARLFMSRPAVIFFTVGGALVACVTTINVIYSTVARGLMAVSLDGFFPGFLGKISARFGTPYIGLTVSYLISVAALIILPSLLFFGSMLNLGLIMAITLVAIAGFIFPKRYPGIFKRFSIQVPDMIRRVACIAVVAVNLLIFVFLGIAIGKATLVFLGIALAASLYSFSRRRILKNFDITEAMPELKQEMVLRQ